VVTSSTHEQPARDLAERYGTHRPVRRRLLVVAVGLVAVAFLSWLAWTALFHGSPVAQSSLIGFRVTDDHRAVATVTVVRRTDSVVADCLLRAQASDHSVVGELSFTVGESRPVTTTLRQEIRTERRATSVSLVGCRAEGQQRLR